MSTGETGVNVSTPNNPIGPLPFRQPPPAHMAEGMYIPDRNSQQPQVRGKCALDIKPGTRLAVTHHSTEI